MEIFGAILLFFGAFVVFVALLYILKKIISFKTLFIKKMIQRKKIDYHLVTD